MDSHGSCRSSRAVSFPAVRGVTGEKQTSKCTRTGSGRREGRRAGEARHRRWRPWRGPCRPVNTQRLLPQGRFPPARANALSLTELSGLPGPPRPLGPGADPPRHSGGGHGHRSPGAGRGVDALPTPPAGASPPSIGPDVLGWAAAGRPAAEPPAPRTLGPLPRALATPAPASLTGWDRGASASRMRFLCVLPGFLGAHWRAEWGLPGGITPRLF